MKSRLIETGDASLIKSEAGESKFKVDQSRIDAGFAGDTHLDILTAIGGVEGDWADKARRGLAAGCPISVASTVELLKRVRVERTIENALAQEYRFTHRSMERGDFVEGIRAMIVEKDRNPNWSHESLADVSLDEVAQMLADLGEEELDLG